MFTRTSTSLKLNFTKEKKSSNNLKKVKNLQLKRLNFMLFSRFSCYKNDFLIRDNSIVFKVLFKLNITAKVIETVRRLLRKKISKSINFYNCTYPYLALTKRPQEVRMGRGKAIRFCDWVYPSKKGKIFCRFTYFSDLIAVKYLRSLDDYCIFYRRFTTRLESLLFKISVKTKFFKLFL